MFKGPGDRCYAFDGCGIVVHHLVVAWKNSLSRAVVKGVVDRVRARERFELETEHVGRRRAEDGRLTARKALDRREEGRGRTAQNMLGWSRPKEAVALGRLRGNEAEDARR